MFAPVHRQLCDGMIFRQNQSLKEELIRLGGVFLRPHKIGALEINGIDLIVTNELHDLHCGRRPRRDFFQFLVVDHHIFALARLVALHDIAAIYRLIFLGAVPDFLDPRKILVVKHVELNVFGACGSEQAHRKRQQAYSTSQIILRPHSFPTRGGSAKSLADALEVRSLHSELRFVECRLSSRQR